MTGIYTGYYEAREEAKRLEAKLAEANRRIAELGAQAADMRSVIDLFYIFQSQTSMPNHVHDEVQRILSGKAGQGWLSPEKAAELREAFGELLEAYGYGTNEDGSFFRDEIAIRALDALHGIDKLLEHVENARQARKFPGNESGAESIQP